MLCAARIMSPIPLCRSRCLRPLMHPYRHLLMRRCWSEPKGSFPSGWDRLGSVDFENAISNRNRLLPCLARIGTSDPVEPIVDTQQLIETFDFSRFGRAPARFDDEELAQLNQKIVHLIDYAGVKDRLPDAMSSDAWEVIRPNLHHMGEVEQWWQVVTGPIEATSMPEEDRKYLKSARFQAGRPGMVQRYLARVDRGFERGKRAQGEGIVHAATPCVDRTGSRPRYECALAIDWQRAGDFEALGYIPAIARPFFGS